MDDLPELRHHPRSVVGGVILNMVEVGWDAWRIGVLDELEARSTPSPICRTITGILLYGWRRSLIVVLALCRAKCRHRPSVRNGCVISRSSMRRVSGMQLENMESFTFWLNMIIAKILWLYVLNSPPTSSRTRRKPEHTRRGAEVSRLPLDASHCHSCRHTNTPF